MTECDVQVALAEIEVALRWYWPVDAKPKIISSSGGSWSIELALSHRVLIFLRQYTKLIFARIPEPTALCGGEASSRQCSYQLQMISRKHVFLERAEDLENLLRYAKVVMLVLQNTR